MPQARMTLAAVGAALDGLSIAFYALDQGDCTICWNRTFLTFFPEHAGKVEAGEPYAANLRRFYAKRLEVAELPMLEQYVSEGLVRNREQRAPYAFEHHNRRLLVSSLAVPNLGRVRIWRDVTETRGLEPARVPLPSRFASTLSIDGLRMLESLADGVSILNADGRVAWVNGPFGVMYDLPDNTRVLGSSFADVYRAAWGTHRDTPDGGERYERGALVLLEHLRFAGAPFELPLPGERWVRVLHHVGTDGLTYMAHVDISRMKPQQVALEAAQAAAKNREGFHRILAEHAFDLSVIVCDGVIKYVGQAVFDLVGVTADELVGLTLDAPVQSPALLSLQDHLLRQPFRSEAVLVCAGGGTVRVNTQFKQLPASEGARQSVLFSLRKVAAVA